MGIAPSKFEELFQAILDSYRDPDDLKMMVRFSLGVKLDEIAPDDNLSKAAFELIDWADSEGKIQELIEAAYLRKQGNLKIRSIHDQMPGWLVEQSTPQVGELVESSPVTVDTALTTAVAHQDGSLSTLSMTSTQTAAQSVVDLPPFELSEGYAGELEIGLQRWQDSYSVDLRLLHPESEPDVRTRQVGLQIAVDELRKLESDPVAYGRRLGQDFFALSAVREIFARAQALGGALRIRLSIDPNAEELNALLWEALVDPEAPKPGTILSSERVIFSRFVSSPDSRWVSRRAKSDLRALVVVANPTDLANYKLTPIDVSAAIERARKSMIDVDSFELGGRDRATLNAITDRLQSSPDILYLVCHNTVKDGVPLLFLEDEAGKAAVTSGVELVRRMREIKQPPRLVVLVSCESASTGESDGLVALGPALGAAGIAAVLVVRGGMSAATLDAFIPRFFSELQKDGWVDRAVAVARGAVRDRSDAWALVLYMRLKTGRLWYMPGFASDGSGPAFQRWPALVHNIASGFCTPILGPGLAESLLGSRRELAMRLAETYRFPMAPHEREDFAKVAQYVALIQSPEFLRAELGKLLRSELVRRLGDDVSQAVTDGPLDQLIVEVAKRRWAIDPDEPHRLLAGLPLRLYVTTATNSLLAEALRAAGKTPHTELLPWNDVAEWPASIYDAEPDYVPTADEPLVYHLFGHLDVSNSLVLTEDDQYNFLIGATNRREFIPPVVRACLYEHTLLFVGLGIDASDTKVVFRTILTGQLHNRRSKRLHVLQQTEPDEERMIALEGTRRYLEAYFRDSEIDIYWGAVEDFMRDLRRQYEPKHEQRHAPAPL